ncbi:hypothetical protein BDP27DRAFT_1422423 [Rhodocollybia butyracea]|uniref:Uncharacterized protein n=1 Tax=Rhodocollybia butyracea TaxID=206335 RepID=A0A9P5PT14_9AGAR|nr:hypothetical protein BDP27DRAFT_1428267 [Rhodocollybia butyracea]KAF9067992.1 hypothetical protein BDP27DRAFT_1422423 [Rhodocollybia butyracea]
MYPKFLNALFFKVAKEHIESIELAEYNTFEKTRSKSYSLPTSLCLPKHSVPQPPSPLSDILEHTHPLFKYPLHRPSIVCKRNGGGRWKPAEYPEDPDTLIAVKSQKGTVILKRSWEVKMEAEEEEERRREKEDIEGIVIIDGGQYDSFSILACSHSLQISRFDKSPSVQDVYPLSKKLTLVWLS